MKKTKKIKLKNNLDEMQEQKMLKIEHNGCWLAFWGLIIVLLVQMIMYGNTEWRYVAGEWIVFMCLAVYIGIDCIRNGIWDRKLLPTTSVNISASLIAGIITFIFHFVLTYRSYGKLLGSAAAGVFVGLETFGVCFIVLSACSYLYKKRVKDMEKEDEPEDKEIK